MLRRLFRTSLLALPLCIAAYLIAAVLGALIPAANTATDAATPHRIALLRGPIHYDILLPVTPQTRAAFAELGDTATQMDDPRATWLMMGWGAATFYTTVGSYRDVTPTAVWRGLTGDADVMRVDVLGPIPQDYPLKTLSLTDAQFESLLRTIRGSFASTTPLPNQGLSATDTFYPALGRFHLFRTCNVWVGNTLRAAGVPFGSWTPLPYAVTLSHKRHAR